jgi:hypothetical protein
MKLILMYELLCIVLAHVGADRSFRRELRLDKAGAQGNLGLLQNLFGPVSRLPKPPPLPENPLPLSAAVFDPMTEAWYTTDFDPFEDSDIDTTNDNDPISKIANLTNAMIVSSSSGHLNSTTTVDDNPMRHHLPLLAKVVSALFRGQDQIQGSQDKYKPRWQDEPKSHGYLVKPTEHSDTMAIRRIPSSPPLDDSPSVPYFDQDIDPDPVDSTVSPPSTLSTAQGSDLQGG